MVDNYALLPQAKNRKKVKSDSNGYLSATNCMQFGIALAMLFVAEMFTFTAMTFFEEAIARQPGRRQSAKSVWSSPIRFE